MLTHTRENAVSTLAWTSASLVHMLILIVATTTTATAVAQGGDGTIRSLRLIPNPALIHHDMASSVIHLATVAPPAVSSGESPKSRKVRDLSRMDQGGEDDIIAPPSSGAALGQEYSRPSSKVKGIYPSLSGSGELFRLFRPLAMTPDKTIGMTKWYLPGYGYFNRGGRAASSNFIRFGRSDGGARFYEGEDDGTGGGDVDDLNMRNNAQKKNNFIRLGRENPRQTNFIRLGRSGPTSPGEYYNSGYITSALSDPFRDDEAGRHGLH